jgi:hypothetical protein
MKNTNLNKAWIEWLIDNVFYIDYSLLTKHQNERFSRLKYGVLNKLNRVETIEDRPVRAGRPDYNKFINTSFVTANNNMIETDINFYDNWIYGFINGEGTFHIN